MIRQFFASSLFDGSCWQSDVLISVDFAGQIVRLEIGSDSGQGERLGGVVIPAMPNLHSHAFQRLMAGLGEYQTDPNDSFWTWRDIMYRIAGKINPDQQKVIARHLYIEMLKAGYTSVCEFHYLHGDPDGKAYADPAESSKALIAAATEVGMGMTLLPVLYQQGGFKGEPLQGVQRRFYNSNDQYLEILQSLASTVGELDNARLGMAFHSLRAVAHADQQRVLESIDRTQISAIHIHIAEQLAEVEQCLEVLGQRPVAWLLDQFAVDEQWCLVHATHLDENEIQNLAACGAVAGLCPTTEANLGDGLFPLQAFLAAGGVIGIGSDSHISVSPIEELRWLEYGQRLQYQRRNIVVDSHKAHCGTTLWQLAAAGGAQAAGFRGGLIEPGCRADWLVLDADSSLLVGRSKDQLLDSLVFSGNISAIGDVYAGGLQVVVGGWHADQELAASDYAQVMADLL
jgi:formimidoylglutamate deiminase